MKVKTVELNFDKSENDMEMLDITRPVEHSVVDSSMNSGLAVVHVITSNTCISTMEYEPGMKNDVRRALEKLGNSVRLKSNESSIVQINNQKRHDSRNALIGPSITIPFRDNRVMLGIWQKIVLIDFGKNVRRRKVVLQIVGE